MVAKLRAHVAAAAPTHSYVPSSTERIWRYSSKGGNNNLGRQQGLQGSSSATSFVNLENSSLPCVVCTSGKVVSKLRRQQQQRCMRFSELRDCAMARSKGMGSRATEKMRLEMMQGSGERTEARQGLRMEEQQQRFMGRQAARGKLRGVEVRGLRIRDNEPLQESNDEREQWCKRLGLCESGARVAQSRQYKGKRARVDEIPVSELTKIQELKFSGDMWEGDSGPQVLDLQRALYWFGHLPTRTCLTAYFGPETTEALQQFQMVHGVPSTGVWGSSSRQALWKHLCAESCESSEGGSDMQSNVQPVASFTDSLSGLKAAGEEQVGIHVSELLRLMGAQDLLSTISSAPEWKHLPRNASMVGLLFTVVLGLLGLGYSVLGLFKGQPGQPVRRRVMRAHWRDDVRGGGPVKTRKQLHMFPGLDRPVHKEEEEEPKYPNYRLRAKSKLRPVDAVGQTDRLIIYDGQVILGDSPQGYLALRNSPTGLRGSTNSSSQASSKVRKPPLPVTNAAEQVPTKQVNTKTAGNQEEEPSNSKIKREGGVSLPQKAGKSIVPHVESHETLPTAIRNIVSALFTPRGRKEPLLLDKPVNGRTSSRAALQSEAEQGSKREGLTQGKLDSSMSGPARKSRIADGGDQQTKDEANLRDRVEELRKAVKAAEQNRQAAMRALAEERQRSLELQVKISRQGCEKRVIAFLPDAKSLGGGSQKEAAAALEEEVRVLKESHDALLASLRKKYSSSVAARAAAALLYQNWDSSPDSSIQNVTSAPF